ncbi:MAG TPA: response regulator transcription factor [Chitinophagaceae bacterium]|jgi:two-component system invasion response regulator UvrY|nr:response regulator transcription factor [Chitinophagaceae bacterium]
MKKTTILIVDDHKLIRETWSIVLRSDSRFNVLATTGSGKEAVELAKQLHPDIVIMDINLPDLNGIEATQLIRRISPGSKILGVSLHTQPVYVRKMMRKGASGYVTKNSSKEEMFTAILNIQKGEKYICNEIKNILSEKEFGYHPSTPDINSLTEREIEIVDYIRKGFTSKEIARTLYLSVKTIEVHRYNIFKKLTLKNTASLVDFINKSYGEKLT